MKNLQFLIFSILFMTAFERGFADEEWVLDPIVKSSGFGDVCPDSAPVAGGCGYSYLQRGCSPTEGFGAIFGVDIQFYRGRYTGQLSSCYDRPPGFIFGGSQGVDPSIPSSQLAEMRKHLDFYSQCGEAGYNYYLLKGKPPERVVDQIGIYNYGDYPKMEGRGCILTYGPDSEVPHMKYEGNLDGDNIRFIRKDAKAWGISPRPVKIDCDILVCTETYLPGDCTVLGPGHPVSKLRQGKQVPSLASPPRGPAPHAQTPTVQPGKVPWRGPGPANPKGLRCVDFAGPLLDAGQACATGLNTYAECLNSNRTDNGHVNAAIEGGLCAILSMSGCVDAEAMQWSYYHARDMERIGPNRWRNRKDNKIYVLGGGQWAVEGEDFGTWLTETLPRIILTHSRCRAPVVW